jgi:hypothetical protein
LQNPAIKCDTIYHPLHLDGKSLEQRTDENKQSAVQKSIFLTIVALAKLAFLQIPQVIITRLKYRQKSTRDSFP